VSIGHVSTIEAGLAAITVETVEKIARGLAVSPADVLNYAPEEDDRAAVVELLRQLPPQDHQSVARRLRSMAGSVARKKPPERPSRVQISHYLGKLTETQRVTLAAFMDGLKSEEPRGRPRRQGVPSLDVLRYRIRQLSDEQQARVWGCVHRMLGTAPSSASARTAEEE
jgi:hypothetical protein